MLFGFIVVPGLGSLCEESCECSVYLSLGGKEEKTKNKVMATVGDRTRAQEGLLQEDSMVESVVLEWNAGGHFADAGKRLAKGVKWMFGVKSGL